MNDFYIGFSLVVAIYLTIAYVIVPTQLELLRLEKKEGK